MTEKVAIPVLTVEQFNALNKEVMDALTQIAPELSIWLYNNKKAPNFIKIKFAGENSDFGYDLVFRKHDADPEIVCPTCGKNHITGTVEAI
jgi:hypothetical protein